MAEVFSEKAIWQMLEQVRGEMPTSDFSVALAALIFLRWADFEEANREAIAASGGTDYEPVLPSRFHWRSWCHTHPHEIEHLVRGLPKVLQHCGKSRDDALATGLHCVAPAVEKLSELPAPVLYEMLEWVAAQPFETPADRRALRDVLDFLLQNTYNKFSGQFYTPVHIAALMVELAKPQFGESVYDPCLGSAGLLTAALDVVSHHKNVSVGEATYSLAKQPLQLAGVEITSEAFVFGLTRLVLSGITDPQLEHGNSLERLPLTNPGSEGFDIVLANPPWGMKVDLYGMDHYPIPTKDSSSLFLQHAFSQLRPGGRGVMVVPQSLLFRSGREQQLREWLLHENTVEAIVSLPRGAFAPHTSIEACLLLFRRGGTTRSVRMVEAESIFENAKKSQLGAAPFAMARQLELHIRATEAGPEWWDVDVEDLAAIDYDLTPKRRDRSDLQRIVDSLPQNAEVRLLKNCCTVLTGRSIRSSDLTQSPPKSNYELSGQTLFPDGEREDINSQRPFDFADTPIPYIRIKDVKKGQATRGSSWLMPAVASTVESKWKLRGGDILLSKSGTIGKAGIVRNSAVGAIAANGFFVLRVKEGTVDPHYLLAYLQSAEANAWLGDRARGAAAKHLSVASIKELPVALPPLQIQQSVAAECREFGGDAIEILSRLLTGLESNPVAQWLHQSWAAVSSKKAETLKLDDWRGLAEESRRLRNEVAHSSTNAGDLTAWTLAFSEALTLLRGAEDIPDGLALFSVLNEVGRRLHRAEKAAKSDLPDHRKARSLTQAVEKWLAAATESMAKQTRLDITTETTDVPAGELTEVSLKVQNRGVLPVRSLRLHGKPSVEIGLSFLAPGESEDVEIKIDARRAEEFVDLAIRWECLTLDGDELSGTKDLRFAIVAGESDKGTVGLGASPYVTGDPVKIDRNDVFFGREELIEQIKRQVLQSGNVVLLEGNRRAGKSSVLWHLEGAEAIPGWLGVYCSLQGAEGDSEGGIPTADVFRSIAYEIVQAIRKLNGSAVLPDGSVLDGDRRLGIARSLRKGISEEAPFQDFREYLEMILETLAEQGLGLLLMLDEFDKLQEGIDNGVTSPQVPENIRFLVQSYSNFSAILTGSRRLKRMREEYWSALFGLGTRLGVSALPPKAASNLVTEPVKGRLSYSKSAINRAHSLTAGQPYLLQCLCNRVFDIAARTGVRSITVDHVNDAADALVEDNEHFASLWDYTEFDRRRFLLFLLHREQDGPDPMRLGVIEAKLEDAGVELREEILIADLEYLRELELVDLHGESTGAYYTLTVPMMGLWLDVREDYEVQLSRARVEAEDISGKITDIKQWGSKIKELEDSMDEDDD